MIETEIDLERRLKIGLKELGIILGERVYKENFRPNDFDNLTQHHQEVRLFQQGRYYEFDNETDMFIAFRRDAPEYNGNFVRYSVQTEFYHIGYKPFINELVHGGKINKQLIEIYNKSAEILFSIDVTHKGFINVVEVYAIGSETYLNRDYIARFQEIKHALHGKPLNVEKVLGEVLHFLTYYSIPAINI